jgi:hypothetical protein
LAEHVGDHEGDAAVGELIGGHILQPFGQEGGDVHVERRRSRERLRVARPSKPLVALRTIGRHVHEIAFLAPDNVVLQLIQERV